MGVYEHFLPYVRIRLCHTTQCLSTWWRRPCQTPTQCQAGLPPEDLGKPYLRGTQGGGFVSMYGGVLCNVLAGKSVMSAPSKKLNVILLCHPD